MRAPYSLVCHLPTQKKQTFELKKMNQQGNVAVLCRNPLHCHLTLLCINHLTFTPLIILSIIPNLSYAQFDHAPFFLFLPVFAVYYVVFLINSCSVCYLSLTSSLTLLSRARLPDLGTTQSWFMRHRFRIACFLLELLGDLNRCLQNPLEFYFSRTNFLENYCGLQVELTHFQGQL